MRARRRRSLRRLLLAATALTSLASFQAWAGDPQEDIDEPTDQDEGRWTISGVVNRALLGWDDGGQRGVSSVDNSQDSTGFLLEGEFGTEGWTSGFTLGFDTYYASSDTVSQLDWDGEGAVIELPYAFFELGREKNGRENWGELEIGLTDSASDEIDNINLAEADAIADASVDNWADQFFLRATGIPGDHGLATGRPNAFNEENGELRWGDFIDTKLAGESGRFVTYLSPNWNGLEGSVAIGQPQEVFFLKEGDFVFNNHENGLYSDGALRYRDDIANAFRIESGIGVWRDTTEEEDATEPTEDTGYAGSLALRHIATGLNASINYGNENHNDHCDEPGAISRDCRGDDNYLYLKGGVVRDFTSLGPTSLYVEYHKNWKRQNDSDEDALRTLERREDQAEELKDSAVSVWGAGLVQKIEPVHPQIDDLLLYLGYRHYALDVDLIGANGSSVPPRGINDFDVVMVGLTATWGGTRDDNQPDEESGAGDLSDAAEQASVPEFEGGAPVYDWSGLYIGAQSGYFDIDSDGFFATSVDLAFCGGGMLAGGQVGWNWQRGGWVLGVEPDFAFFDCSEANLREEQYVASTDFLSMARGRVVWADDNVLFYGTGGLAFIHASVETSLGGQDVDQHGNEDSKDVSAFGGVVGAGIEWGVTRNLSIKAEALRLFFDRSKSLVDLDEGCAPGIEGCLPAPADSNFFAIDGGFLFRIGANWKLWSESGAATPYGVRPDYLELPAGPYDWSGFHFGPHLGYGEADTGGIYGGDRMTDPPSGDPTHPAPINLDFENKGFLAGGQAGFDWQSGHIVYGVEGDVSAADWDDRLTDFQTHGAIDPQTIFLNLNLLATARGRIGWADNDRLYYLTGGLGFLQGEFRDRGGHARDVTEDGIGDFTSPASRDVLAVGGVVGAGIEWGVTPDLSVKAEGLYLAFDEDVNLADLRGVGASGDHLSIGDSFAFRLGGNWRPAQAGMSVKNEADEDRPLYDWSGFYAGPSVGWGGLVTDGLYNPSGEPFDAANQAIDLTGVADTGVVGGGEAGMNWQMRSMLVGVEGDVAAVDWKGSEAEFANPGQRMTFKSDVLATLRGRLGWAEDDLLFYVTGGLAFATAELDNTHNDGGRTKDLDSIGGAAGLGMEWGVTSNLSIKTEGLFLAFDDYTSIKNIGSEGDPGDFFLLDDGFVARVGANWRFNPKH